LQHGTRQVAVVVSVAVVVVAVTVSRMPCRHINVVCNEMLFELNKCQPQKGQQRTAIEALNPLH